MSLDVTLDSLESVITEKLVSEYEGDYEDLKLNFNEEEELDRETEENQKLILNIEAKYHGYALVKFNNGIIYEGNFSHGLIHGNGTLYWPNKTRYEGNFVNNRITGEGIIYYSDGLSQYQGQLLNGKREGFGKLTDRNGQEFEGEWKDGKRNGVGLLKFKIPNQTTNNQVIYFGDFKNNRRHGYGIMKYESGNTYEGEWVNDQKHGYGIMNWNTADQVYTGYWKDNLPHGEGELIWGNSTINKLISKENCNIYRGEFEHGERSGQGTFFFMNGSQYSGEWLQNNKHGIGCFVQSNGSIMSGNFNKNQFVLLNNLSDKEKKLKEKNRDAELQYALYLSDVLSKFPISSVNFLSTSYENILSSRSNTIKKEIERVLLKYNQFVKSFYLKYNDFSNKLRIKDFSKNSKNSININELNDVFPLISVENRIKRLKFATNNSRNILNRFFSSNVLILIRSLRELSLINSSFNTYDLLEVLKQYREEFKRNIVKNYIDYYQENISTYKENNSPSSPSPSTSSTISSPSSPLPSSNDFSLKSFDTELKTILSEELLGIDYLFDTYQNEEASRDQDSFMISMRQPLKEFEFINMIARVVLEVSIRQGFDPSYLTPYQVVEKFLAEKLVPLVQDPEAFISSFYHEFYSDKFQDYLQIKLLKPYYHYLTEAPSAKLEELNEDEEEKKKFQEEEENLRQGEKLIQLWSILKQQDEKVQTEKDLILNDIYVKKLNLSSHLGGSCSFSIFLSWIQSLKQVRMSLKKKEEKENNGELEEGEEKKEQEEQEDEDLSSTLTPLLVSIIFPGYNQLDAVDLSALLDKRISFEDFLEYLARVMLSTLWTEEIEKYQDEQIKDDSKEDEKTDNQSSSNIQQESSLTIENNPNSLLFKFSLWINNYSVSV